MKKKVLTIFCLANAILTALLMLRAGLAAFCLIKEVSSISRIGIIGGIGFPSVLILWIALRPWILPAILLILLLIPALIWLTLLKKAEKRKE